MKELRAYELAPNDLCFLLESCLRCYYLKLVAKVKQPSSSFPAHYTMIDSAMKRAFLDRAEGEFNEVGTLRFRVEKHNGYVKSIPIVFEDLGVSVAIRGTVDGFLQDDGEKRVLVDYKTHASDLPKLLKYRKQLMAYRYAAENPADPKKYPIRSREHSNGSSSILTSPTFMRLWRVLPRSSHFPKLQRPPSHASSALI